MKALTLKQPWASLVAAGIKTLETRSGRTSYRGPLIVHAGKRWAPRWSGWLDRDDWRINALDDIGADLNEDCNGSGYYRADRYSLPLGAIVATAQLVDCVPMVHTTQPRNGHCLVVSRYGGLVLHGDPTEPFREVSDQRPFGDFSPGRWAWLLDDIKPTTERCPACWGNDLEDGLVRCVVHRGQPLEEACFACWNGEPCPVCDGAGHCDPIPAKGRRGLWNWHAVSSTGSPTTTEQGER